MLCHLCGRTYLGQARAPVFCSFRCSFVCLFFLPMCCCAQGLVRKNFVAHWSLQGCSFRNDVPPVYQYTWDSGIPGIPGSQRIWDQRRVHPGLRVPIFVHGLFGCHQVPISLERERLGKDRLDSANERQQLPASWGVANTRDPSVPATRLYQTCSVQQPSRP